MKVVVAVFLSSTFICCGCLQGAEPDRHWQLDAPPASPFVIKGRATAAEGVRGQSLALDGESLIEIQESADLTEDDAGFTFTVWVNPYALDRGQQVIAAKNRYSLGERQWGVMIDDDACFRLYMRQGNWKTTETSLPPEPGHWHLIGVAVRPGEAELWVNGRLSGTIKLTQPLAKTDAPLTLGGINDGGRFRQTFLGALDDARLFNRSLDAAEMAALYTPVAATHAIPKPPELFKLWDSATPLPGAEDIPVLDGVEFQVIKRWEPENDGYQWLHGVGLGWHKGKLFASFGHNQGAENTATEEANYRVSDDGGRTWSGVRTIDSGVDAPGLAVSHGVFHSHNGTLWAFHGAFNGRMNRIHTRAYTLDEATEQWVARGVVVEGGFWAMNQPVKLNDGNWIMSGIAAGLYSSEGTFPAAVAISRGNDFTQWDLVKIPAPEGIKMWGESGVIIDGPRVLNIARYGGRAIALAALSDDLGRTWTTSAPSNLPMATSKPCAGMLSSGQRYLICTTTADTGGRRAPLTIAVSKPGADLFSQVFVIRPALFPDGPGESNAKCGLAYPCAVEHDGKLYVGYSNSNGRRGNHNSAELAIIPIDSLAIEP